MSFPSKNSLSYPFLIQILNKMIKRYVNTYWTIVDLICRKSQKISDFFYEGTINDEYEREHNVIHLKKSDMILHIGCGVYPYSAIVLSKNPHQKIVAIDNNDHAIQHAKHIISDHNLQKEIDIDKGDGGSYHLNSFSVIIVSSCVDLTKNVLDHIIKDAKPKTRIIIRELRPMSRYVKKYLKQRKSISFINQFSIYSFPFYSILGWDSFIIQKTS